MEVSDTLNIQLESVDVTPTEPEPVAVPAEEMVIVSYCLAFIIL